MVNTITPKLFSVTQSVAVGEGLNFCPGLRMETNCQNCGFTQVRMNGMEGSYSQILINSRPIFSGLAGVYGLELIPSNMIEKVEVVRGGGSALYGSNAIAGTINLILKNPISDSFEFGISSGTIGVGLKDAGKPAHDFTTNMNATFVSDDKKSGFSVYGFYRKREAFDANNDDYSEVSQLENTTIGSRYNHRFGYRNKITIDVFHINESRRGGNKFDQPNHQADISEALNHSITTAAVSFDMYLREHDLLTFYSSGQSVNRDSYYGAGQSLADYGKTSDFSYNNGVQYKSQYDNSKFIFGLENTGGILEDQKLGYPDYDNAVIVDNNIVDIPNTENTIIADQTTNTTGIFSQYEIKKAAFNITVGARFDNYSINNLQNEDSKKTGNVFSPRISILADIMSNLQARFSLSKGYRAPQIFDEDLHIETSNSRKVIHKNSPNLKEETSRSIMASLDYNTEIKSVQFGILAEVFATQLVDPFANEYGELDENGTIEYTRVNADGTALVQGVNFELNIVPNRKISLKSGYTFQSSKYSEAQEFNETKFLRTPNHYGYFTVLYDINKKIEVSATGNITGKMLVPHFGVDENTTDPTELIAIANGDIITGSRLENSDAFFDMGLKISYYFDVNNSEMQIYAGVKNLLNSYQGSFDSGQFRDPAYIYGPSSPRIIQFGVKLGNMLR